MPTGELKISELLELGQSNATPDLEMRSYYAERAQVLGAQPGIKARYPVAEGKAAALRGLADAMLDKPMNEVEDRFNESFEALLSPDYRVRRERIATFLNKGRGFGFRVLEGTVDDPEHYTDESLEAFHEGDDLAKSMHEFGGTWDRYALMLSHHRATFVAMRGSAPEALGIAAEGVWRTVRADREGAKTPIELAKHAGYVIKHTILNVAAGGLAVSRLASRSERVERVRNKIALKIMG